MNKAKAEQLVNEAVNIFTAAMELPCEIPVYILSRQEADASRTELMRSLGAEYEDFQDTTIVFPHLT